MQSILLLVCPKTHSKGTAFLLKSGAAVTAAHVVAGCSPRDIVGVDGAGEHVTFSKVVPDTASDLALLRPTSALRGGLDLASGRDPDLGTSLWAWGFPFGYLGPAPLVSVGYLAGFNAASVGRRRVKHLVVNGAFNLGSSGGPVCEKGRTDVLGVVVSKHVPLDPFVESALSALAQHKAEPHFTAVNARGSSKKLAQSEIVAEVFSHYRHFLQVMIGEAVAVSELRRFLEAHEREVVPRGGASRRSTFK